MSGCGKSLLIVHQGALGDFLTTFPAIFKLKKRFCRIDAFCQSDLGRLACALKVIDSYLPLEAAAFASLYSEPVDARAKALLMAYHEIILFSNSGQLEQTIQKTAEKKICRIPPRPDLSQPIHISRHIFRNLENRGLLDASDPNLDFILPSAETADMRNNSCDPLKIAVHPGSGSRKKQWPLSNFIEISASLRAEGLKPELILGPAEYYMADLLLEHRSHIGSVRSISDLGELATVLKRAAGFIGNDSGVSHLAALLGLPTVAVFGPSDPKRWHPIGRAVEVVRPELDCSPCFETGIQTCKKMECFDGTSPETVKNAFFRVYRDRKLKNND